MVNGEGCLQTIILYHLSMVLPNIWPDSHMMQHTIGINPSQLGGSPMNSQMPSGTPISIQTQMMKMQPMSQPQPRILLNRGMCLLTTPSISVTSQSSQTSPSKAAPWPTGQSPNDEMKQISCPICRESLSLSFSRMMKTWLYNGTTTLFYVKFFWHCLALGVAGNSCDTVWCFCLPSSDVDGITILDFDFVTKSVVSHPCNAISRSFKWYLEIQWYLVFITIYFQ